MGKVKTLSLLLAAILIAFMLAGCSYDNANDYEEGISAADNIVNTTAADKVILVVSFGTSYNQSRSLTIGGIEAAIRNAYPDYQVRRAFTSQIIIDKLAKRDKLNIDNVTDAMNRLVLDKVKDVVIQPTMVMNGFEYDDMIAEVMPFADKFESLRIGKHLLSDDIDYDEVAEILIAKTSRFRADDAAIVYMGHGTEHEAGVTYAKLQNVIINKGYVDYIIGTVEHGLELEDVQEILAGLGVKKVVLLPLMIVAGDHANNDMAGDDDDSWKVILTKDGYAVETVIEGLGQNEGIQDIFIRHVQDAINSNNLRAKTPTANAAGVLAYMIKNGDYVIDVDSNSSMFRIVDCRLTVENGDMTAVVTLSGQGYQSLYLGTAEQALTDNGANYIGFTLADERHTFTLPVAALDIDIDCAALGARSGNWYDHVVIFKSDNIPGDAFERR